MTASGGFGCCRCGGCVHTINPEPALIILFEILYLQDITFGLSPPDNSDAVSDCTEFTDLSEIDEVDWDMDMDMVGMSGSHEK